MTFKSEDETFSCAETDLKHWHLASVLYQSKWRALLCAVHCELFFKSKRWSKLKTIKTRVGKHDPQHWSLGCIMAYMTGQKQSQIKREELLNWTSRFALFLHLWQWQHLWGTAGFGGGHHQPPTFCSRSPACMVPAPGVLKWACWMWMLLVTSKLSWNELGFKTRYTHFFLLNLLPCGAVIPAGR